jgi:hypothetical protein
MPRKTFTAGDVLTASDMNTFLMDQAVQTYADSTARDSAVSTATAPAGLVTYLEDEDAFEYWNGTAYEPLAPAVTPVQLDSLIIAGGGGGGTRWDTNGGGGGAGGYLTTWNSESSGGTALPSPRLKMTTGVNYTVTIGAGGALNTNGNNTLFGNNTEGQLIAVGGGRGVDSAFNVILYIGGSGGGGMASAAPGFFGRATKPPQGFDGAASTGSLRSAGGGGAGSAGASGVSSVGGNGGSGLASTITGTSVRRGGGGAGGGNGGVGTAVDGGGAGNGGAGSANTGGGGASGTGSGGGSGGAGGSGVVILRYPATLTITIGAGLTGTTATVGTDKVTTITLGTGNVSWA